MIEILNLICYNDDSSIEKAMFESVLSLKIIISMKGVCIILSGLGITSGIVGFVKVLFTLIALAASIALGVYIYRDANKRNMDGTFWLLIVCVSWVVGAVVYLIVRDDNSAVECPNCNTVVKGNNAFCPKCGTEVKK